MKSIRMIAIMIVFASMVCIAACGEKETASLEGNEDIAAVLQKLPECLDSLATAKAIYAENAILHYQDGQTAQVNTLTGSKEIGNYLQERGKEKCWINVSIQDIKKEADTAHVVYQITSQDRKSTLEYTLNCSAEMVKQGQMWKIKEARTKYAIFR